MFDNFMGSNMDLFTILLNFITYNPWEVGIIITMLVWWMSHMKIDRFSQFIPAIPSSDLKGLTQWELFTRLERVQTNIKLLNLWLQDLDCDLTRSTLQEFMRLERHLKRALFFKRLKNWLFSLVGR